MGILLSMVTLVALSSLGDVKTGRMLGLEGGLFFKHGLYEIDLEPGTELATLLFLFDEDPSEGGLAVSPAGTLYAAFSGGFDELVIIDPDDESLTFVGPFGFEDVSGLAFGPDGTLYGHDNITCQLITVNLDTGEGTAVGHIDNYGGGGLAFGPDGVLYAAGAVFGDEGLLATLFTVDPETAEAKLVGPFGLPNSSDPIRLCYGLEFVGKTLYASAETVLGYDSLYMVNTDTGLATEVGFFDPSGSFLSMGGLAFLPGAGDVDRDGDVDFDDYNIFVSCFTGPIDDPGGDPLPVGCVFLDSDDDNDIDCLDWEAFIVNWTEVEEPPTFEECDGPPPCEGDANGDNVVDPLDAGYVSARFGCPVGTGDPECDAADPSGDGLVDPLDLGYVLSRFGSCP